MSSDSLDHLRYPVGRFSYLPERDDARRAEFLASIRTLPERLQDAVKGMSEQQLSLSYRPGGWTIRQVIHHLADSHLNAYIRFKLALTEDTPTIKPYDENAWAELPDSFQTPVSVSLSLIEALHKRWTVVLESMSEAEWDRKLFHPEHKREMGLKMFLALYAWHGEHHLAHVKSIL